MPPLLRAVALLALPALAQAQAPAPAPETAFTLSAEGDARFDEPTLSLVVGPWLYVVAASGWRHFSDSGALNTAAAPHPLVVRVLR